MASNFYAVRVAQPPLKGQPSHLTYNSREQDINQAPRDGVTMAGREDTHTVCSLLFLVGVL